MIGNEVDRQGAHWTFSLAVYGGADVQEACLFLQDAYGVDVNVLLLCAYRAAQGLRVDATALAKVDEAVAAWRESAILPLRHLRRDLKKGVASVPAEALSFARKRIADAEIAAEMVEQELIMRAFGNLGSQGCDRCTEEVLMTVVRFYADRGGRELQPEKIATAIGALLRAVDGASHLMSSP